MSDGSYNQFCPVSMAAEIICSRWTLLVLRELVLGSPVSTSCDADYQACRPLFFPSG